MPKVTFENNMFFEGTYYKAGKTYVVTDQQAVALGGQVKRVFNPLAKTTTPAKKKAVAAPPADKMVKAAPKSKAKPAVKKPAAPKAAPKKVDAVVTPDPLAASGSAPSPEA